MAFLLGRLASEKSFIAVIVVVVVPSKFYRFPESSQQEALEEVPSNFDSKCRRAERYCFPLFSFSLSLSFSCRDKQLRNLRRIIFKNKRSILHFNLTPNHWMTPGYITDDVFRSIQEMYLK